MIGAQSMAAAKLFVLYPMPTDMAASECACSACSDTALMNRDFEGE